MAGLSKFLRTGKKDDHQGKSWTSFGRLAKKDESAKPLAEAFKETTAGENVTKTKDDGANSDELHNALLNQSLSGLGSTDERPISLSSNTKSVPQLDLWEKAYDKLSAEKGDLVNAWKVVLAKTAGIKEGLPLKDQMSAVIDRELLKINNRQWKIRIFPMQNAVAVRKLVDKIVLVFEKVKDFGATAASVDPVHAGIPFAGICVLVPLIANDSQQHETALKGLEEITDIIDLYAGVENEYLKLDESPRVKKLKEKLENLYFEILDFLATAACHFDRNTLQRMVRNIPKVDGWEDRLQRVRELDSGSTGCRKFADAIDSEYQRKGMKTMTELLDERTKTINEHLKALNNQFGENSKVISWVSNIDAESDHHRFREKLGSPYQNSGQWLRSWYDRWTESIDKPTFWLYGSVGTGKSSLVSHVIEWHSKKIQSSEAERLVFFYCSRNGGKGASPEDVFRSLVAQLAWSVNGSLIAESVKCEYKNRKNCDLSLDECQKLLRGLIAPYQQTTVIIDALDECEDYNKLLIQLKIFADSAPKAIKFFFSGRTNVTLPKDFPTWEKLELDSQKSSMEEDMKRYVETQVKDRETLGFGLRLLRGKHEALENRLVRVLPRRAQGMFRWAELQLAVFFGPNSRIRHPKDVINRLEKLEKETGHPDLDRVYAEIYDMNTNPGDVSRTIATRAFKWMMCTERPLHIKELAEAASFENDKTKDEEVNEELILEICSNFIIADASKIAQFAHLSVREYLEKRQTGDIKEFSPEQAHAQAAVTCLACLLTHRPNISGINDFKAGLPGYSVLYWALHWEAASENRRSGHLGQLYTEFWARGHENSPLIDWVKVLPQGEQSLGRNQRSKTSIRAAICSPPNPFFAACVWGFSEVITDLPMTVISNVPELNVNGERGLSIASAYGHEAVAKLLLEQGADVEAENEDGWTALHFAAWKGHKAVARLLLEQEADIKAEDGMGWTALHFAAHEGHEAVARLLLEQGAEVDVKAGDENGWTALHFAAWKGHEAVARLLLKKGADVKAVDEDGWTALHYVAMYGHEAVTRLLLEQGADVEAEDKKGKTALYYATRSRRKAVAQLLKTFLTYPNSNY